VRFGSRIVLVLREPHLHACTQCSHSLSCSQLHTTTGNSLHSLPLTPTHLPNAYDSRYSFPSLTQAVNAGLVNTSFIDRAAANVLRAKFAAGLFDNPLTDLSLLDVLDSKAHRDLARRVATEGTVLLLNNMVRCTRSSMFCVFILTESIASITVGCTNFLGCKEK
jgi:hypothetical protein